MRKTFKRIILILAVFIVVFVSLVAVLYSMVDVTNGEITSSGQVRRYLLYVPESYNPATPTPLVISLHGFAEWPAHMMQVSGWNDLADEVSFLVVYPAGTKFPKRWHVSRMSGTQQDQDNDITFVADLIDHLSTEYNIDRSRVYANGFSNGGGMAHLLACELSDQITAVGGVAGAYSVLWENCNPSRPVPMIAFHGTDDPIVPYSGGVGSPRMEPLPDIPKWVEQWAWLNGCDLESHSLPSKGEVEGIAYTTCDQNAEVRFYTINGGGHSWPGGGSLPVLIVGHTTQDIDATEVIWNFYRGYSLPAR